MAPIEDLGAASPTKSGVGKVEAIAKYITPPRSPITSTSSSPANSSSDPSSDEGLTSNFTTTTTTTTTSTSSSPSSDEELLIKTAVKNEGHPKSPLSSCSSICDKEEEPPLWSTVEEDNLIALYKYRATPLPKSTILEYFSPHDDYDMDPTRYFEKRLNTLSDLKESGKNPYPNSFTFSMSISDFIDKYGSLKPDQRKEYVMECLAGRLMNKLSSSNLITYDLVGFGGQIQVMALPKFSYLDQADFFTLHSKLKCGDYVGVIGFPGRSSTGEMSIIPRSIVSLSYCLRKMPPTFPNLKKMDAWTPGTARYPDAYLLKDQETRYRHRFLDLMINSEVKDICKIRAKVISYIRHFLDNLGFLEVETPILTMVPGGAAARPFVTYYNELDVKMCMRIAPELYLKQLVVGGIERVYEIGKQFRDEGIDEIHNPEFTSCEFCMTLADYKYLMELTEQLLSGMVKELTGGYKVTYHANGYDNLPIEIDFTPPFRRISMIEELEKMANLSIPKDLASDEARQYLADACTKFDINCQPPQTAARLLDKLVRNFLVDTCVNPTFIMEHPEIMSPLAKSHETKPGLTERFELFVNKFELINAYTELDDPVVQRQRFADQLKDRRSGDEQTMPLDETFCMALEYGLPPSAGWGLGIDRLTMLLTDSQNIKEVILFPAMKRQPHELPIKEEIVAAVVNNNVEDEAAGDMPSEEPVTLQEAIVASKTLHKFLLQSGNTRPVTVLSST